MKKALVTTAIVASPFVISVISVSPESFWRFWGLFWGFFVVALTFGFSLWFFTRKSRTRGRAGRWIAIATLLLLGGLTTNWIVMWGFEPFTLEGAWIYPLAICPLSLAAYLIWAPRRRRRDMWAKPPALSASRLNEG